MVVRKSSSLVLVPLTAIAAAAREVVPLTSSNFSETIKDSEMWLLKFYAPVRRSPHISCRASFSIACRAPCRALF